VSVHNYVRMMAGLSNEPDLISPRWRPGNAQKNREKSKTWIMNKSIFMRVRWDGSDGSHGAANGSLELNSIGLILDP
jgi:hypothetical protein